MLASRVLKVAEDILADYKELNVSELLQTALQVSSRALQGSPFTTASQQIKVGGEKIISSTRLKNYPQHMRSYLQKSAFGLVIPENIGRFLVGGFQGDINATPYTPEVQHINNAYNTCLADMTNLKTSLRKLGIAPLAIPVNQTAIDFVVPRDVVKNDTRELLELQDLFCVLVRDVNEYLGVSELSPKLVYTSTTDPVIAIATSAGSVYTVVKLFTGVLRAAKAAVELYNAVAILRNQVSMRDAVKTMLENAQTSIKTLIEKEVAEQLSSLATQIDEGRKNELVIAITLKAVRLAPLVAEGVSIGVSVESLESIRTLTVPQLQAGQMSLVQVVSDARKLETDTRAAIAVSGGASVLRLTQDSGP